MIITIFPPTAGGGGGTIINNYNQYAEVNTFADLPSASSNTNKTYQVKTTTGVIFVNRKLAGFYRSNGTSWDFLGDTEPYAQLSHIHSYSDLVNKPTIPTVPTALSSFTNDVGYLTSVAWSLITGKPTLSTVATSGSYTDLSNKPVIPTVPTALSSFTNDSGFITNSYHDSTKQDSLVSGTNIKTVGGQSLLGSGDVTVGGYVIGATEVSTGSTRNGKVVYTKEIDCGAMPNNTTKTVAVAGLSAYSDVWLDTQNSMAYSSTTALALPYAGGTYQATIIIDKSTNQFRIIVNNDFTAYTTTKVVLRYTK